MSEWKRDKPVSRCVYNTLIAFGEFARCVLPARHEGPHNGIEAPKPKERLHRTRASTANLPPRRGGTRQVDRVYTMLNDTEGWVCGITFVQAHILRYSAVIWTLRQRHGLTIAGRLCRHGVYEFKLERTNADANADANTSPQAG